MIYYLLVVSGLIVGSLLSALVDRWYDGRNWLTARSTCDHCKKALSPLDLIPLVSWLVLQGRCRQCSKKIAWRYPALEISLALSFALFYFFYPVEGIELIYWLVILAGLAFLTVYDFRWFLLPSKMIYFLAFLVIIKTIIVGDLLGALGGSLVGGGIFYLVYVVTNGRKIGGGDVRLGALLGALLANYWLAALMIFVSSLLGLVFILPAQLLAGKIDLKHKFPYGPFLILAMFLVLFFGEGFLENYWGEL